MYFNVKTITKITSVTARQLQYWDETGLLKPSVAQAEGRGTRKLYSFVDVVQVKTAKTLRDQGVSLQKIRTCIAFLRKHALEIEHPLSELRFLTDGKTIFILTTDKKKIMDTLSAGQFVMSIAIGELAIEARAQVEKLTQRRQTTVVVDDFEYQVVIEPDKEAGGYVVFCPAIKGCVSQGDTIEEALEMIKDAIAACLEVLEERKGMTIERKAVA